MLCDDEGTDKCEVHTDSHQKLEETSKGIFPRASGEGVPLQTPWFRPSDADFGFLASRTTREYVSVVLSHSACGDLL